LTPQMAAKYAPIQAFEAKQLSVNLLDDPDNFYMHNRRYATSVILQFVYGRRVPVCIISLSVMVLIVGDCEEVRQVYGVLSRFVTYRRPGSFLVDTFPSLAEIPLFNALSNWKQVGEKIHKADAEVFLSFWNQMLKDIQAGTAKNSFGRDFVQSNYKAHGLEELDAAYTAYDSFLWRETDVSGGMIEAGSETTSMQLNNMLIGVLSNPQVLLKAHEELDGVVGSERPPAFEDAPNLPYIHAIVKVFPCQNESYVSGSNEMASHQQIRSESFCNPGDQPLSFNANIRTIGMENTSSQKVLL
jgi:hypothetical protein